MTKLIGSTDRALADDTLRISLLNLPCSSLFQLDRITIIPAIKVVVAVVIGEVLAVDPIVVEVIIVAMVINSSNSVATMVVISMDTRVGKEVGMKGIIDRRGHIRIHMYLLPIGIVLEDKRKNHKIECGNNYLEQEINKCH